MPDRVSALSGHYQIGLLGKDGEPESGVVLSEVPGLILYQVAAWPHTLSSVGVQAADIIGVTQVSGPGTAAAGPDGALLRIEPLKWWCYNSPQMLVLDSEQGTTLDLSHSRTHLRVRGPQAQECLNRLVPLDLRTSSCPVGSVMSTAFHHVGITLWHSDHGFELFVPRGFALSLWEVLVETAAQFGAEIV